MIRTLGDGKTLISLQVIQNWEEVSDTQDGCAAIQRNFNRLQKWASRKLMKLKKRRKCKILAPVKINSLHQDSMGMTTWKATLGDF